MRPMCHSTKTGVGESELLPPLYVPSITGLEGKEAGSNFDGGTRGTCEVLPRSCDEPIGGGPRDITTPQSSGRNISVLRLPVIQGA